MVTPRMPTTPLLKVVEKPLLKVVERLNQQTLEKWKDGTGFTSIEMVHTHTHALPRQGFFALFWKSSEVTEI